MEAVQPIDFKNEKTVCEVSPSQVVNLKAFTLALLAIAAIVVAWVLTDYAPLLYALAIPIFYAFWKWLEVNHIRLKLTDQRLIVSQGILNKKTNETELYRVRDSTIEEPFFYRLFKLGNIVIYTTDDADAILKFRAYKKPHWLKDQVRQNAEICRHNRRWGQDNIVLHDHAGV